MYKYFTGYLTIYLTCIKITVIILRYSSFSHFCFLAMLVAQVQKCCCQSTTLVQTEPVQIATDIFTDSCGSQRIIPTNLGNPLTFPLVQPFLFFNQMSWQLLDRLSLAFCTDIRGAQRMDFDDFGDSLDKIFTYSKHRCPEVQFTEQLVWV